jgi:hypothetical protein
MFKRSPNFPLEKQPKSDGKSIIDWFVSDFTFARSERSRHSPKSTVQQSQVKEVIAAKLKSKELTIEFS